MNAEEARRQALENTKGEISQIQSLITKSVKRGETEVRIDFTLKEGTKKWALENGYHVFCSSNTDTLISW